MTQIRIRHADEAEGRVLGEVPFTREAIDAVIPLLQRWGVTADGDDAGSSAMGQFVVDATGAYFEVIFGLEDWS